jgi:hypothetical protein
MKRKKRPHRPASWALMLMGACVIAAKTRDMGVGMVNTNTPETLTTAISQAIQNGLDWGELLSVLGLMVIFGLTQLFWYVLHHPDHAIVYAWAIHDWEWLRDQWRRWRYDHDWSPPDETGAIELDEPEPPKDEEWSDKKNQN